MIGYPHGTNKKHESFNESNDYYKYGHKGFEDDDKDDDDINNHDQSNKSVSIPSIKKKPIQTFDDKKTSNNNKKYQNSESNLDGNSEMEKYSDPDNKSNDTIKFEEAEIPKENKSIKKDEKEENQKYNANKMEEYLKKQENEMKAKSKYTFIMI